jgi:transaldolase
LLFSASQLPQYQDLFNQAIEYAKSHGKTLDEQVEAALDKLAVTFGEAILKIVPGKNPIIGHFLISFNKPKK